jgi:hypothetical protein
MDQRRLGGARSTDYGDSSINRMSWAALLGVEHWLRRAGLSHPEIDGWLTHLWNWSVTTQATFRDWYGTRPDLVDIEQTGQLPEHLSGWSEHASIPTVDLQSMIFSATDIIYANMFGGIQWKYPEGSLDAIADVLDRYELGLPPPDCLPPSSRSQIHGWGDPVDQRTLTAIRGLDWDIAGRFAMTT